MKLLKTLCSILVALTFIVSATAHAALITLDTQGDLEGFSLGGGMTHIDANRDNNWSDGGHVYTESWSSPSWMTWTAGTFTLNSFDVQAEPWDGYGLTQASRAEFDFRLVLFDMAMNTLFDSVIVTDSQGAWTTETFNIAGVHQIFIDRRDWNGGVGFWPRLDNILINEDMEQVPAPASLALLAVGLVLLARRNRKA